MPRSQKELSLSGRILATLLAGGETSLITPRELRRRLYLQKPLGDLKETTATVSYLIRKGYIRYSNKNNDRFLKLTKDGN